ncbi:hypothetical protein ACQKDM_27720, partial [Serratia proteamaculans]
FYGESQLIAAALMMAVLLGGISGWLWCQQALIRLFTSGFGLANLTVPFDQQKRGFQDIWAKTKVVVLPKVN